MRSKLEDTEMNLKRSEFQVQELNRAFLDRQDGKTPAQVQAACDDTQHKIHVSTLEAMYAEVSDQLKEEKSARRMLEGRYQRYTFCVKYSINLFGVTLCRSCRRCDQGVE